MTIFIHVGGTNGVGKTSVLRRLQEKRDDTIHINAGQVMTDLSKERFQKPFGRLTAEQKIQIASDTGQQIQELCRGKKIAVVEGHYVKMPRRGRDAYFPTDFGIRPNALVLINPRPELFRASYRQSLGKGRLHPSPEQATRRLYAEGIEARQRSTELGVPLHFITTIDRNQILEELEDILTKYQSAGKK